MKAFRILALGICCLTLTAVMAEGPVLAASTSDVSSPSTHVLIFVGVPIGPQVLYFPASLDLDGGSDPLSEIPIWTGPSELHPTI